MEMELNRAYEPAESAYQSIEPLPVYLNDEIDNSARRDNSTPRKSTSRYCAITTTALIFAIFSIVVLAGIVVAVVLNPLKSTQQGMCKLVQFYACIQNH